MVFGAIYSWVFAVSCGFWRERGERGVVFWGLTVAGFLSKFFIFFCFWYVLSYLLFKGIFFGGFGLMM